MARSVSVVALCLLVGALVEASDAQAQAPATSARVDGIAYDSLARKPLANALISVVGVGRSATSDTKGRFRIDSVTVGTHTFLLQHPAFDSIGLSGSSQRVFVQPKGERVVLALPSFETLWRGACGDAPVAADSGLVYGSVRDAATQAEVASVVIDASWIDLVGGGSSLASIGQRRWRRESLTDARGEFAVCGVPLSTPLSLSATRDSLGVIAIELPASRTRVQRRDLLISRIGSDERSGAPDAAGSRSGGETDSATVRGSTSVVMGIVVDKAGMPVANAVVSVDTASELRTGDDGRFFVRQQSGGTRLVSVRAIGRLPFDSLVNVREADTTRLLVSLSPVPVLEAVKVTATITSMRVRGYEERKRNGFGAYRDSSEIKNYPAVLSVLRTMPSVSSKSNGLMGLVFNIGTPAQCVAKFEQVDFRLDGMPITVGALEVIDMQSIAAMEVYSRATKMPSEIMGSIRFRCAVLLWTKQGFGR